MANLARFRFTNQSDTARSLRTGWQLRRTKANALAGDDLIEGRSEIGIQIATDGVFIAESGDDTISGSADDSAFRMGAYVGFGIRNQGVLSSGAGNDTICGRGAYGIQTGLFNDGSIQTGSGGDHVEGFGHRGIRNAGELRTGLGRDAITADGTQPSVGGGDGLLNEAGGLIDTGREGDAIRTSGNFRGMLNSGRIITGSGGDSIHASGDNPDPEIGDQGLENRGLIALGAGNDRILCTGTIGLDNSGKITMDRGDDAISASGNFVPDFTYGTEREPGRSYGIINSGRITTGAGNDVITGSGNIQSSDPIGIDNDGTILTGAGRDTVNALHGGFQGSGRLHLGRGNDTLIGFVHARGVKASFVGGDGRDAVLLDTGVYTINDGLITLAGTARLMRTSGFERIGGIHGGLFVLADGELTITNGVAVSLL